MAASTNCSSLPAHKMHKIMHQSEIQIQSQTTRLDCLIILLIRDDIVIIIIMNTCCTHILCCQVKAAEIAKQLFHFFSSSISGSILPPATPEYLIQRSICIMMLQNLVCLPDNAKNGPQHASLTNRAVQTLHPPILDDYWLLRVPKASTGI